MKSNKFLIKALIGFASLIVAFILIMSAPADAFSLNINLDNPNPNKGDIVTFDASVDIENGEILPIDYLQVKVVGPRFLQCRFYANGTAISGCNDFNITVVSSTDEIAGMLNGNYSGTAYNWGYGTGYGYAGKTVNGKISYNVRLNTANMVEGYYNTSFEGRIGGNNFVKNSGNLLVGVLPAGFDLNVYSPVNNGIYNTTAIPLNITTGTTAYKIMYKTQSIPNTLLCTNCKNVSMIPPRFMLLANGWNNITVTATDMFGRVDQENITIFLDKLSPRLRSVSNTLNSKTNGTFGVKYDEINLQDVTLYYGTNANQKAVRSDCLSGYNKNCTFSVDLSAYDGQNMTYYFEIRDIANNVIKSNKINVTADTTSPVLNIVSPVDGNYGRYVKFNITTSEKGKIEYRTNSTNKWNILCTNCNGYGNKWTINRYFMPGNYAMDIRATDYAGNSDVETRSIRVI